MGKKSATSRRGWEYFFRLTLTCTHLAMRDRIGGMHEVFRHTWRRLGLGDKGSDIPLFLFFSRRWLSMFIDDVFQQQRDIEY